MSEPLSPTVVIVPGLRDHVAGHWQTLLAARLEKSRIVPPLERDRLSRAAQVAALDAVVTAVAGPVVLVAHSAGVMTTVQWAQDATRPILGALLATPADLEQPLPHGYPTTDQLDRAGWNPIPRAQADSPHCRDAHARPEREHRGRQQTGLYLRGGVQHTVRNDAGGAQRGKRKESDDEERDQRGTRTGGINHPAHPDAHHSDDGRQHDDPGELHHDGKGERATADSATSRNDLSDFVNRATRPRSGSTISVASARRADGSEWRNRMRVVRSGSSKADSDCPWCSALRADRP